MSFPSDCIEHQISTAHEAWQLLNTDLPQFKAVYNIWQNWYEATVTDAKIKTIVNDVVVIAYARMALRNGTLSKNPRHYHSEKHIDDLLLRLVAVSQFPKAKNIPEYGWSLLSIFMACHDLRQSEDDKHFDIIGNNEKASYKEALRIISAIDKEKLLFQEHKELLKLMIYGSTFGEGKDNLGNIYQGNLVEYLVGLINYFEDVDLEIAYLACDIDTANVAASLKDYANSSINVYQEIQEISNSKISAYNFFGEQQEKYFFNLQQFNSKLGKQAFLQLKAENEPKIKAICEKIKRLDKNLSNQEVVENYKNIVRAYL
ncbi:MAG TPA: hypothetical protein ENJ44_02580 [Oceanospirillales bacterium]|nr:hypothetical protein [Oceanospirillales bacterium]